MNQLNPAADWFAQQLAEYNQTFTANLFSDHASMLGVQPMIFGFPSMLPQVAPALPRAGAWPRSKPGSASTERPSEMAATNSTEHARLD
jgi:hypothetical protein